VTMLNSLQPSFKNSKHTWHHFSFVGLGLQYKNMYFNYLCNGMSQWFDSRAVHAVSVLRIVPPSIACSQAEHEADGEDQKDLQRNSHCPSAIETTVRRWTRRQILRFLRCEGCSSQMQVMKLWKEGKQTNSGNLSPPWLLRECFCSKIAEI
jgi:hypothetical protein